MDDIIHETLADSKNEHLTTNEYRFELVGADEV